MTPHSLYESRRALAISGQLSQQHTAELLAHSQTCAACRDHLQQLHSVHTTLLLHTLETCDEDSLPAGALERFRTRAIADSVPLQPSPKPSILFALVPALATVMAFAMLLCLFRARTAPPPTHQTAALASSTPSQSGIDTPLPVATPPMHHRSLRRIQPSQTTPSLLQQAALAPERFQRTAPALDSYFAYPAAKVQTATFPSLSSEQILHLSLFHSQENVSNPPSLGLAALHLPANFFSPEGPYIFAPNLERLRFTLPSQQ